MNWFEEAAEDDSSHIIETLLQSSSDDEQPVQRGGSRPGRAPNINRDHELGAKRLYEDYFSATPVYGEHIFRRRFRVSKRIFLRLFSAVKVGDPFFTQRSDATGRVGLSGLQKATAAMRQLAYGYASDATDEYLRIGSSTADKALHRFAAAVNTCFQDIYLRAPNEQDLKRILAYSEQRGFPGMLGSIDCCKWVWKNCPVAWHGQYEGKEGDPTVTLEAIADHSLWIWHAFFGMPGSGIDINVLEASPLLNMIANGTYPPPLSYKVAGEEQDIPYWLADGIYPPWPVFVQQIVEPMSRKEKLFSSLQPAFRKDVERAFGVLQSKWHIIARPSRIFDKSKMNTIMRCCVIMHNMMVEERIINEEDIAQGVQFNGSVDVGNNAEPMWASFMRTSDKPVPPPGSLAALCATTNMMQDPTEYFETRRLLVDNVWMVKGSQSQ